MKRNNEDNNSSYSQKLKMMQQFYRQKMQTQQGNNKIKTYKSIKVDFGSDVMNKQDSDDMNPFHNNNNHQQYEANLQGLSYYQIKDKIKELQINDNFSDNHILKLNSILIQNNKTIVGEQQKQLYVEVLELCNTQSVKYMCNQSTLDKAFIILNQCDIWTQAYYDFEPQMRILTLINLGKISSSLESFYDALKIILQNKQNSSSTINSSKYSGQLNNLIGQHSKALDQAQKAFKLCQSDFVLQNSSNPPNISLSCDQQVQYSRRSMSRESIRNKYQNNQLYNQSNNNKLDQIYQQIQQNQNNQNKQSIDNNKQEQLQQKKQNEKDMKYEEDWERYMNNEWTENILFNLILCYESLSKEEEYIYNFEQAEQLIQKSITIAQQYLYHEHPLIELEQNKLNSLKQRHIDYNKKQSQNMIQKYQHLSIKPILQNNLNEESLKCQQELLTTTRTRTNSASVKEKRSNSLYNLFSNKKVQSKILLNSPYNQTQNNNNNNASSSNRQNSLTKIRNSSQLQQQQLQLQQSSSRRSKVIVIRQKKLSVDQLPNSLKFNITNSNHCQNKNNNSQNSILSNSTASTKMVQDRKFESQNITNIIQKQLQSVKDGNEKQDQLLQQQNNIPYQDTFKYKQFLTSRISNLSSNIQSRDSPRKIINQNNIININNNQSNYNDGSYTIYPSPRLNIQRDLQKTKRQQTPDIISNQNCESIIQSSIENKIQQQYQQSQQHIQNLIQMKRNRNQSKGNILATSNISSPTNTLISAKTHLQTFVDQMKINRDQINLQFQQLNSQFILSNPISPLAQMFGDHSIKSGNNTKKILIYSDAKGTKNNNQVSNHNHDEIIKNKLENQTSQLRQKAFSLYQIEPQIQQISYEDKLLKEQLPNQENLKQQQQQYQQKDKQYQYQQYIQQQLQNKLKIDESLNNQQNNNIDQNTTRASALTRSNSSSTIQGYSMEQQQQQKQKSSQKIKKYDFDENIQLMNIYKRNKGEFKLLYEIESISIKVLNYQQNYNNNLNQNNLDQSLIKQNTNILGSIEIFLNQQSMIITIIFKINEESQQSLFNDNQFNNENNNNHTYKHIINISDLLTNNQVTQDNQSYILNNLCQQIISNYLQFDLINLKLVLQIDNNNNFQKKQSYHIAIQKTIEPSNQYIFLQLVQKDNKSSFIYCVENNNDNEEKQYNNNSKSYNQIQRNIKQSFLSRQNSKESLNIIEEQNEIQSYYEQMNSAEINKSNNDYQNILQNKQIEILNDQMNIKNIKQYSLIQNESNQILTKTTLDNMHSQNEDHHQNKMDLSENKIISSDNKIISSDNKIFMDQSTSRITPKNINEKKEISVGSVKFISYYQVNSQESSLSSSKQFHFDESHTLRNSSAFKEQNKPQIEQNQS